MVVGGGVGVDVGGEVRALVGLVKAMHFETFPSLPSLLEAPRRGAGLGCAKCWTGNARCDRCVHTVESVLHSRKLN